MPIPTSDERFVFMNNTICIDLCQTMELLFDDDEHAHLYLSQCIIVPIYAIRIVTIFTEILFKPLRHSICVLTQIIVNNFQLLNYMIICM